MAEKISGVYRIRNVVSGRFYIGSSEDIYRRFESHRKNLRNGKHSNIGLQTSWIEHGEDVFKFDIVYRCGVDQIREVERRFLVPLLSHPMCTNMHDGTYVFPRTGMKHTEETKAKISAKVQAALAEGRGGKFIPTEETRRKMSEANKGNQSAKGHVRTDEHRARLSEANKGNKNWLGKNHSEESKAKMGKSVKMTDPSGNSTIYPRTTAIKEKYGIFLPTILRSIRSGEPLSKGPYKGWRFEYV